MNPDVPGEREPAAGGWRAAHSRRIFLRRGTLAAATLGVVGSVPGLSTLITGAGSSAPTIEIGVSDVADAPGTVSMSEPLLAQVKDLSTGEISLYQGEQEVIVHDPFLARSLLSAARS